MKKFLLTLCMAALFCIAAMAQQQDKKQKEDNKYRSTQETKKQQQADQPEQTEEDNAVIEYQDVEVLDSKEGPNNEVVYKYQGELYYVDREEKKMVKVEESQLKDSNHKVQVKDVAISTLSKGKSKRSKG